MSHVIELTRTIVGEPDRVWRALVSSSHLAHWAVPNADMDADVDVEPQVGEPWSIDVPGELSLSGVITELEAPTHLAVTLEVLSGNGRWAALDRPAEAQVSLTLEAVAAGTKLTLVHTTDAEVDEAAITEFADRTLGRLSAVL